MALCFKHLHPMSTSECSHQASCYLGTTGGLKVADQKSDCMPIAYWANI